MLRSHLYHLLRGLHNISSFDGFGEHIGKRLFHVAIFAGLNHLRTKLGMLKITGRNHHAVDILIRQHLLGVFVLLRFQVEGGLHLLGARIPRQSPDVADRDGLHRGLLACELGHDDVARTAAAASKLCELDAVICSDNSCIGACWYSCYSRSNHRACCLLKKLSAVAMRARFVAHIHRLLAGWRSASPRTARFLCLRIEILWTARTSSNPSADQAPWDR